MVDNVGNTASTAGTITVGNAIQNTVDHFGDHDWFRINLSAGQAITVALDALLSGPDPLDPYLIIRNSSGQIVYEHDDTHTGVDVDSLISFAADYTGAYYIDVGGFENSSAGDYRLSVTAFQMPPVYTNDQIAEQLVSGYWGDGRHPFNISSGGSLTVNVTGLDAAGQVLARQALLTWKEITGINFVETTSTTPQIMFTDDHPDGSAFTEGLTYNGQFVTSALVNVDTSWLAQYGSTIGSYGYQTYLHEIGHALGLGHAGNYNDVATYPFDALYLNDAFATSVMSYFSQTESDYFNSRGFSHSFIITPMVADILAVQQLYGLSTTTRSGNTTYGFNSNAGTIYNAQQNPLSSVAYTIFDTGGTDTLDYSGYSVVQRIDLNAEQFSNVGGQIGNVTIARATIIENAIGGSSADVIIGNSAANVLTGRAGVDTLTGGIGNDTFQDTRSGLNGDTVTDFTVGDRIVFTDATLTGFSFNLSGSTLSYTGGSLTLSVPVNGPIVASAAAGGGVQLSAAVPIARNAGDFNGDGRSDVLLRHDNGWLTEWLGQANGSFSDNGAVASNWIHPGWQVVGIGDFNGGGRDDLLLRHSDGTIVEWLGQANGSFVPNGAATNWLHAAWDVVSTGDFNGDDRVDVLLRHDNGWMTEWLGQANGSFSDNGAVASNWTHPDWQVAGSGDFNGDGRSDVLLRHNNGWMTEWLGQANGSFLDNGAVASNWTHPDWQIAGIGDFNGDGRDDLLLRHSEGTVIEWLGQPNGSLVPNGAATSWLHAAWDMASSGDFNGDGRDDLLLRHNDGTIVEWLGQANGSFSPNNAATNWADSHWHVQLADIF